MDVKTSFARVSPLYVTGLFKSNLIYVRVKVCLFPWSLCGLFTYVPLILNPVKLLYNLFHKH